MGTQFVNRVLKDANKWLLKHSDGSSETVTLESKATVVTEGTPLSADNLNGNFTEIAEDMNSIHGDVSTLQRDVSDLSEEVDGCVRTEYLGGLIIKPCTQEEYDSMEHDPNTLYAVK